MEDGSSIRKTTEEEKEDAEIAAAVNRTLAKEAEEKEEEEKKKKRLDQEKKKKQGEQKNRLDQEKGEKGDTQERSEMEGGQDEARLPANFTCPVVTPCLPCKRCEDPVICPDPVECPPCEDCLPCRECGPCPIRPCKPCKECGKCPEVRPCEPGPVANHTMEPPSTPGCPEPASMTVPVAMAVGACASLLVTGVATALGLLLRYVPPTVSGFLILTIIVVILYLCSQYPETARELGGRAATLLREAVVALGHRVMAAIQRHQDQVGLFANSNLLNFEFYVHLRSLH